MKNMGKKIKVLIITHAFPTKYNPIASIFLLQQLNELKKYCDVKIIFPYAYVPKISILNPYHKFSAVPFKETFSGMEVYHPKYFMFPRFRGLYESWLFPSVLYLEALSSWSHSKRTGEKLMEAWNPDIIHIHGQVSESLIGVHLKQKYKKPLLVTLYGSDLERFAKKFPTRYLSRYALDNSDKIIVQSKFQQKILKKMGFESLPIPMGALLDKFKPRGKNASRKALNLPLDKKIILFVGHLFERKGVEYLVRAMNIVKEKDSSILCCIIGSGSLESSLKKLSEDLELEDYIAFLGQEKRENIPLYMNACDVVALPSLSEGLPVVLCEALASGKPVVATNVFGTPELVDKDTGYLVKPKNPADLAEKILLALNKRWDKSKLTKKASGFSVANSAGKILKLYEGFVR